MRIKLVLGIIIGHLLIPGTCLGATLDWNSLPDLPNPTGVAGPIVGVHNDVLIVAGGANFPNEPLWETDKVWHDTIHVLTKAGDDYQWLAGGHLAAPRGYAAAVSTSIGVVAMGGNDSEGVFDDVSVLTWNSEEKRVVQSSLPKLPTLVRMAVQRLLMMLFILLVD